MKVYELIQALAQYDADKNVKFHLQADICADVDVEFDDYLDFYAIQDNGNSVSIELEY